MVIKCQNEKDASAEGNEEPFSLLKFVGSLNVEPCAFLLTFASMSRMLSIQQLFQDKLCIQRFNQSDSYCSNLAFEVTSPVKQSILSEVTRYNFYDTLISAFPGIFWCLFVGSWCDKYKGARKLFIILCCLSGVIENSLLILNSYFFEWDSIYSLIAMFPGYSVGVLYGGYTAIFSYISAHTKPRYRALRFMSFEILTNSGNPLGQLVGGKVLALAPIGGNGQLKNYIGVMLVGLGCYISCIIWTLITVNEKGEEEVTISRVSDSQSDELFAKKSLVKEIFTLSDLKAVWKTVTKPREDGSRLIFWILILCHGATLFPLFGFNYIVLPTTELLYFWDVTQLAHILSIGLGIKPFALLLLFFTMTSKYFSFNDMELAIIGTVSNVLFCLCFSTILSPTGLYLAYTLGLFSSATCLGIRSYITKILPETESSKALGVVVMLESILPLLTSYYYSAMFRATISFYPTLSYHITSFFLVIAMAVFSLIDIRDRRIASIKSE